MLRFPENWLLAGVVLGLVACPKDDASRTAETGSETDTVAPPPLADLSALLAEVPTGTAWVDLAPDLVAALEAHAAATLGSFRAQWDEDALSAKEEEILAYSAGPIIDNVQTYLLAAHGWSGPVADLDPALDQAVRRLYLAHLGATRNSLLYNGVLALDWDGITPLVEPPLPDATALADLQRYADQLVDELTDLIDDGTLPAEQEALARSARITARSLRGGSLGGYGYGADELQWAPILGLWTIEPTFDYVFLGAYPSDEDFLRAQNAMLLGAPSKYGSGPYAAVASQFTAHVYGGASDYLSDPEVGRVADLLLGWWEERLLADPSSASPCYAFTAVERDRVVDTFTADLREESDPTWLTSFHDTLGVEGAALTASYQDAAIAAVDSLFDDAALPPSERAAVAAAVHAEPAFGAVVDATLGALTAQTGSEAAAGLFQAALDAVPTVGGGKTLDPADEALVQQVWTEVRTALVDRYAGPTRVKDIASLPMSVTVDLGGSIRTSPNDGSITVGLGRPQGVPLMRVILTHEALHSFNAIAGNHPVGGEVEGAASLTEHGVGLEILASATTADELPLWLLADLVTSDARRYGISDATRAVLETDCAGGADSAQISVDTAASWGMSGAALGEVPIRAHFGTQFLAYLAGEFAYRDVVAWFEAAVNPTVDDGIDPFDLASCGIVNPRRTAEEAATVAACLGL